MNKGSFESEELRDRFKAALETLIKEVRSNKLIE